MLDLEENRGQFGKDGTITICELKKYTKKESMWNMREKCFLKYLKVKSKPTQYKRRGKASS